MLKPKPLQPTTPPPLTPFAIESIADRDVQTYSADRNIVSISHLSLHVHTGLHTVPPMLKKLSRKGRIRPADQLESRPLMTPSIHRLNRDRP